MKICLIPRLLLFQMLKKDLKNIRISNIKKLIFGNLTINSLRNKFDLLCEQVKGSIDIFTISETKLDDSFPHSQFLIECFYSPFRFDCNKTGDGILLYFWEGIPAKVPSHDFPTAESFLSKLFFIKRSGLLIAHIIRIRAVPKIIFK